MRTIASRFQHGLCWFREADSVTSDRYRGHMQGNEEIRDPVRGQNDAIPARLPASGDDGRVDRNIRRRAVAHGVQVIPVSTLVRALRSSRA